MNSRNHDDRMVPVVGRFAVGALVVLLTTGCQDDTSGKPADSPDSTRAPASGASSLAPASIDSASIASAEQAVPLEDVVVQRHDLGIGPDWMALDEHGLWLKLDRSPVALIDPVTGKVLGRVRTGYELPLCQGIGAVYGMVYVCKGTDLLRIDPESMRVVARIPLHKEYGQGHLPGAFGRIWVLESDGSTLTGLDPETGAVVSQFKLPVRGFDMAAGPEGLWVAGKIDDKVIEVDPDSGAVLVTAEVANPEYVTVTDQVWVAGTSQTFRIDPGSGEVLATVEGGSEPDGSITSDDRYVYVRNATDFLIQIDKETGDRVAHVVSDTTSGGDVIVAGGDVWASAVDDLALIRLHPQSP